MSELIRWIAVGDSFTYLNDHLDETAYKVKKGYLTRTMEKLSGVELFNMGINGSITMMWLAVNVPRADLYTILLGTNDWFHDQALGTNDDFEGRNPNTILGCLAIQIDRMRRVNPDCRIIVMNPVERGDFVYVGDATNNAHNSSLPENGVMLSEVADAIYQTCVSHGIDAIDLHKECGFTVENVVRFKHVKTEAGYKDLPWPEYAKYAFDPKDEYPYPEGSAWMTYDGLHPSDEGNEIIAEILAKKIKEVLGRE